MWEMNPKKRQDLRRKLKDEHILSFGQFDKPHFKSILVIFIFQQMMFLRFETICTELNAKYAQLINIVLKKDNCPVCDFNKFIDLLKDEATEL
jgi:hypothetical protein